MTETKAIPRQNDRHGTFAKSSRFDTLRQSEQLWTSQSPECQATSAKRARGVKLILAQELQGRKIIPTHRLIHGIKYLKTVPWQGSPVPPSRGWATIRWGPTMYIALVS